MLNLGEAYSSIDRDMKLWHDIGVEQLHPWVTFWREAYNSRS